MPGARLLHLAALVLFTALTGDASAEPPSEGGASAGRHRRPSLCENSSGQASQGYKVPRRRADSSMPWEFFLGNASHRLIGYVYGSRFPANRVFYNKESVKFILQRTNIGDWSLLLASELNICPDITDVTERKLFEIKPSSERALEEGKSEVQVYLKALNRAIPPEGVLFLLGTGFEGAILIQFASGQYIWRLEWCTTVPGVIQYYWTRSQQRFDSTSAAYSADAWAEITEEELKQYGGWVAQAVEEMVNRRELVAQVGEVVGIVINVAGGAALVAIEVLAASGGASPALRQSPGVRQVGQVLPFTPRPSPPVRPVQLPKASGM